MAFDLLIFLFFPSLLTLSLITGFLNFRELISTLFDRIITRVDVTVSLVVWKIPTPEASRRLARLFRLMSFVHPAWFHWWCRIMTCTKLSHAWLRHVSKRRMIIFRRRWTCWSRCTWWVNWPNHLFAYRSHLCFLLAYFNLFISIFTLPLQDLMCVRFPCM